MEENANCHKGGHGGKNGVDLSVGGAPMLEGEWVKAKKKYFKELGDHLSSFACVWIQLPY